MLKRYRLFLLGIGLLGTVLLWHPKFTEAQTCGGTYGCGINETSCLPAEECTQTQCANLVGACHFETVCTPDFAILSCSGSSQIACENSRFCGIGYDCGPSNDFCTWTPGGSTPTPTAGGGPTPTPGGGCVGCGTQCGDGTYQTGGVVVNWENTSICNCGLSCAGWQSTQDADGCNEPGEPCIRACYGGSCGGSTPTPTPTACVTPSPPTNVSLSCTLTQGTLSWTAPAGVSVSDYPLRIERNDIQYIYQPEDGTTVLASPYTFSVSSGNIYDGWMHVRNTCGLWSSAVTIPACTVVGPTATPTNTSTPTPTSTSTPTPTPYGTIRSRAVQVSTIPAQCADLIASTTGLDGTTHTITGTETATANQSSADYVTFSDLTGGSATSYTINVGLLDPNWALAGICLRRDKNSPPESNNWTGYNLSDPTNNETFTWDIGYTPPGAWTQTRGGDVYSRSSVSSLTPVGIDPREFNLDDVDSELPGVVLYNGSYDFSIDAFPDTGKNYVSSEDWLVANDTYPQIDYYELFFTRMGTPHVELDDAGALTKPASNTTPYYGIGDYTTQATWNVNDGETLMIFINGNLTIGGDIRTNGTGFVAFIVSGNITVDGTVGIPPAISTPSVEGVYITNGTFTTETGDPGKERIVLSGMFIADSFILGRDLDVYNDEKPAETFVYNPSFLITMPEAMMDLPYQWQEVAP